MDDIRINRADVAAAAAVATLKGATLDDAVRVVRHPLLAEVPQAWPLLRLVAGTRMAVRPDEGSRFAAVVEQLAPATVPALIGLGLAAQVCDHATLGRLCARLRLGLAGERLLEDFRFANRSFAGAAASEQFRAARRAWASELDLYARRAAVRSAFASRPDLPLSATEVGKAFQGLLGDEHALAIRVLTARRQAGLPAAPAMLLPSGLTGTRAAVRAATVLAGLTETVPPATDVAVAAANLLRGLAPQHVESHVWRAVEPCAWALRADTLTEGAQGPRTRLSAACRRLERNLQDLPAGARSAAAALLSVPLRDLCTPDPAAAALAAACLPVRTAHDGVPQGMYGGTNTVPWGRQGLTAAAAQAAAYGEPRIRLQAAARWGVSEPWMTQDVTVEDLQRWPEHADCALPESRQGLAQLPTQLPDKALFAALRPRLGVRLRLEQLAAALSAGPRPDLRRLVVDEATLWSGSPTVQVLAPHIAEEAAGLDAGNVLSVAARATRPGAALAALRRLN